MNVGSDARHISRKDVEEAVSSRIADSTASSSIPPASTRRSILGNSARICSDRELLTHSEKVRTASSEVTRNGVQQAVLVAETKNDQCSNSKLIDFIFNLEADGWKLFSIP